MDVEDRQSLITRLKNSVPLLFRKRPEMSKPEEFRATDVVTHRYAKLAVLKKKLIEFKIPEKEIRIRATKKNGLEMQLPRPLTENELENIHTAFEEEEARRVEEL
ncbi:hypothetical protein CMEL01_03660 [Colletotrichum melonis]|uniref:Uncharacterized protein n=1 Tax=Colletotrichum melonis TaxID=1209925 RepID=A0AAI9XP02_9PEZI|nr:hypothetical protein CMEL01_03660 [Colletotrichum melonis]